MFADRGRAQLQVDVGCFGWSKQQIDAWNDGHQLVMQETMRIVQNINPKRGLVIPNGANIEGVNGRMWENFKYDDTNGVPTGDDLDILMKDNGIRIAEAHKDDCNSINKTLACNQTLAAYLIGAYEYTYYGCTQGFYLPGDWDIIWENDDYHEPLGPPLANATFNNDTKTYFRNFTKGVNVWLDYEWNKPCVKWSDGSITGSISDCSKYTNL